MCYTSVITIHTTPSNELVLFWLLRVSIVLMISREIFTIYVIIITIKVMSVIATDAPNDPTSFIISLNTSTSTILIASSMIMFISVILIVSMIIFIYIMIISLMVISICTVLFIYQAVLFSWLVLFYIIRAWYFFSPIFGWIICCL